MSQSSALKKAPQGADRAALKQQLRDSARDGARPAQTRR